MYVSAGIPACANGRVCVQREMACCCIIPESRLRAGACILVQEQLPAHLQGLTAASMDMPMHERSLSNSSLPDSDPIRADLSHGIMPSPGTLGSGSSYFDPRQLSPHSLVSQQQRPSACAALIEGAIEATSRSIHQTATLSP